MYIQTEAVSWANIQVGRIQKSCVQNKYMKVKAKDIIQWVRRNMTKLLGWRCIRRDVRKETIQISKKVLLWWGWCL